MKKILTASLVAMMAVSAANADIASTQYVTDRTGNLEFTGSLQNQNLTQAISKLQTEIGEVSGVSGGVVSGDELEEAIAGVTDKIGTVAQGETVVSMITGALDDAEKYTDDQLKNYTTTTDMTSAINSAKSAAIADAEGKIATAKSEAITAAEAYADGLAKNYDAAGSAEAAETAAKAYADGLAGNYDAAGAAATAKSEAIADAQAKIEALNVTDTAVAGEYVSAVSEANGKISVTRAALTDVAKMTVPEACEKGTATCALVYDNQTKKLKWESIINQ